MDIDDKELFSSAMADEPISDVADPPAEAPATEAPQPASQERAGDDRPRDEHGRFAPRQPAEPEPDPQAAEAPQEARDNAHVPPWRLREIKEERDAINARYLDTQRQLEMLQRQMPKPEPKPAPDLFENPTGAIEYGVQQGLTPYEQRLQAMEAREQERQAREQARLEFYSRREAFREHGEPTVRTAYDWLANGVSKRDPDVMHVYNRAMQSEHPYDAVVQAYKRVSIVQQIEAAGGVDKWREQQLSQQSPQQQSRQTSSQPQGSITKLPPSLRNTPSARGNGADDEPSDMSDAALFRHAMR